MKLSDAPYGTYFQLLGGKEIFQVIPQYTTEEQTWVISMDTGLREDMSQLGNKPFRALSSNEALTLLDKQPSMR